MGLKDIDCRVGLQIGFPCIGWFRRAIGHVSPETHTFALVLEPVVCRILLGSTAFDPPITETTFDAARLDNSYVWIRFQHFSSLLNDMGRWSEVQDKHMYDANA